MENTNGKGTSRKRKAQALDAPATTTAPAAENGKAELNGKDAKKKAKKEAKKLAKKEKKAAKKQAKKKAKTSNGASPSSNGHTKTPTENTTTTTTTTTTKATVAESGDGMELMAAFHNRESISLLDQYSDEFDTSFFPFYSFNDAARAFPSHILSQVSTRFQKPTPIQAQCWPILMAKRDIVGIAETGSGKTLAFMMPALVHIQEKQKAAGGVRGIKGPLVLILSPTRELAMQTADVTKEVPVENVRSLCVYGGVDKGPQRRALRDGIEIVVATPGRLLDLMQEGAVSLANVSYLILDEADRMLDLGFEPDIRKIVAGITQQRQTLMFSATWPTTIQQLAAEFLSRPVRVSIGSEDLVASHSVTQIVEVVDERQKDSRLLDLLRQYHSSRTNRILVFVLYKKEAVRVERMLQMKGWKNIAIHGDKDQANRTRAIEQFKSGDVPLLIATDVAARGLDIPGVEYVINYSFPLTIEDYVHRIGRTGRGGSKGTSHTLFTMFDKGKAGELVNVLREAGQEVPAELTKFGTHVKKKEHALYGAHFKAAGADGAPPAKASHVKFD
eukprot:TRINITY_DN221_c0_g1_i1.p1 TRINITY_DN221_c0_g1~~TRINITY_DN221_c0_g1_i1.p1  ORF type:complete len:594 (-),score=127.11 TRINITY_DN221_c0_g1_i1:23-1699(-)